MGRPEGVGIYEVNGDYKYIGDMANGLPNGHGKLIRSDGDSYIGVFEDGNLNGFGRLLYSDGATYEGNFKNFYPEGKGKYVNPNGWSYSGLWSDGYYDGQGIYKDPSGGVREGTWVKGSFKNGVYDRADGRSYKGEFIGSKSILNGYGKITYENGDTYEGEVRDNIPHGSGTATYSNLAFEDTSTGTYVGEFVDGKRNGQGEIDYGNGRKYIGQFLNNKPHGLGKESLIDGELLYSGEWANGKKNGVGLYLPQNSGWNYFGHFKDNNREGFGVVLGSTPEDPDTAQIGYWKNSEISGKSLEVFLNLNRVKFCTPIPNKNKKCVSNNPFEWKIPIREYFFENDYLAPNLKYAFFKLSEEDRRNISKYNHLNLDTYLTENGDSSWSAGAFAWLASLAAVQYGSLSINDPELVEKVIADTVEMSNNLSNPEDLVSYEDQNNDKLMVELQTGDQSLSDIGIIGHELPLINYNSVGDLASFYSEDLNAKNMKVVFFWDEVDIKSIYLHKKFLEIKNRDYPIFSFYTYKDDKRAEAFLERRGNPYNGVMSDPNKEILAQFGGSKIPYLVVIDESGVIVHQFDSQRDDAPPGFILDKEWEKVEAILTSLN